MRLILDTHIFLWSIHHDRRLSARARELIEISHDVYVSSACLWELSIKVSQGKLTANMEALIAASNFAEYRELPVQFNHAAKVATLPPIHRDPFDRILVAQAMVETIPLLTADRELAAYTPLVVLV